MAAALVALAGGLLVDAPRAHAASYPSWADVLAARGQESSTRQRVGELQSLLGDLHTRAAAAQTDAERRGTEFEQAQSRADRAADREQRLRRDAEDHAATASRSAARAGQFAAQLSRAGSGSITASLLADGARARDLLYELGSMSRITEQASGIEAAAVADAAVARSLRAQADRAATALADLAAEAERRMAAAQQASDAAQSVLEEQRANEARVEAQLATLVTGREHAEAEFAEGEAVRKAAEEAAARAAAEEAARRLAAQRAAAAAAAARPVPSTGGGGASGSTGGSGGTGSAGGAAGAGGGAGWVRPGGGGITSVYGWRVNPVSGRWAFHDGVDLGSGCSTAIVAAAAGTVDYVGWYGGYGNYVRIDHGNGLRTAYGHIVSGGFRVQPGQRVAAGTLVALVGSTGNSTGCHLHFETRPGGTTTDPVPFLAARGVSLR